MNEILEKINVLSELERLELSCKFSAGDEVLVVCPFHEDKKPSCAINIKKKVFHCHACAAEGDFISFMARATGHQRRIVTIELEERYGLKSSDSIDRGTIERHHNDLWAATPLLEELYKRGVTDDLIRKHRLGRLKNRITIPIFDEFGECCNIRKYLPGAPKGEKFKNLYSKGGVRLFPRDQLSYESIIVTGGELKALVTAMHMNPHGIGAITTTAGEGAWKSEFTKEFTGKTVYICMDIDAAGTAAAESIAARLSSVASVVKVIKLDLDPARYATGDLNDYFGSAHKTALDLLSQLTDTPVWVRPESAQEQTTAAQDIRLTDLVAQDVISKRISTEAVVAAAIDTPYAVPQCVSCLCDRNQDLCSICPIFSAQVDSNGAVKATIPPESPSVLKMVGASDKVQHDALRQGLHIPPCKSIRFVTKSFYTVEEVRLTPVFNISDRTHESLLLPCFSIGHGLELNKTYRFTGRALPHPKNQQVVLLSSEREQTKDALAAFELTESEAKVLEVFNPTEWTLDALNQKLSAIYTDLEDNVTRIFLRHDLHAAMDLCFFSPLLMKIKSHTIKGWVELLVLGDSAQGKSELVRRLTEFYGVGEKVDCKNASVAGLLGGLQQVGTRWLVSWGIIPLNDRRLVILEELKGASVEIIGHLTEMRSTGIAELPKIEKRRTHARTRIIAISNPRRDVPVSGYSFGVDAIKELIGSLEDIRRFDLAIILSADQIDEDKLLDALDSEPNQAYYGKDESRKLLMWAWTRTPEQVVFGPGVYDKIITEVKRLCNIFSDIIPLVDRGSMRHKLARLSAALAARTFSFGSTFNELLVRDCHVEYVSQFLERVYSDPFFGYDEYSKAHVSQTTIVDSAQVLKKFADPALTADFVCQLIRANEIKFTDIRDWSGWDTEQTMSFISSMVRLHAFTRDQQVYRKNPALNSLLKSLLSSGQMDAIKRPSHIDGEY